MARDWNRIASERPERVGSFFWAVAISSVSSRIWNRAAAGFFASRRDGGGLA